MKKMLLVAASLVLSSTISATTLSELAGSYKITNPDLPVLNIVSIDAKGNVKLTEQSPYGTLECKGKGKIKNSVLESNVSCTNGASFTQKITLKNIKNLNKFKAVVYSSLYDQEVEMDFERL